MIAGERSPPSWFPLFAKLFAGLALMVMVACIGFFEIRRLGRLAQMETAESLVVTAQTTAMIDALHRIRADLLILSRQSELAAATPGSPALAALAREYAEFAHAVGLYDAIRLLDLSGRELIAVSDIDGEISFHMRAAPGPLSPQVRAAVLRMAPGGMLMLAHDRHDGASPRPLWRFATTAAATGGKPTHIVEVAYRADVLLDQMEQIGAHTTTTLIVADRESLWLAHPLASALTWGFDHVDFAKASLPQRYPVAWGRIQSEESGVIRVKDGVFVFRTAHPAIKGFWGLRGDGEPAPEASEWKIISFLSPEALAEMQNDILQTLLPFAFASILALGLGAWIFAVLWAERRHRHIRLLHRASVDPLTGALNRSAFDECLAVAAARYEAAGEGYALIFADLDEFKEINDIYGHEAGDDCLRETVLRIRACIRDSDAVGRLGGDEFVVLLAPCRTRTAAEAVRAKIADRMEAAAAGDTVGPIRASLGLAVCPDDGESVELLLRIADQAMYGAKREHRTPPGDRAPPNRPKGKPRVR
ncbi:GGDEF domain-containing protein [Oleispirillum naphthae]|uniref:GGDEF domain-containing protein n=1 Tax=Oleispirillum naphthae TaxID=2838853 RepID=UPI0030822599